MTACSGVGTDVHAIQRGIERLLTAQDTREPGIAPQSKAPAQARSLGIEVSEHNVPARPGHLNSKVRHDGGGPVLGGGTGHQHHRRIGVRSDLKHSHCAALKACASAPPGVSIVTSRCIRSSSGLAAGTAASSAKRRRLLELSTRAGAYVESLPQYKKEEPERYPYGRTERPTAEGVS
jgi:hypothetical protein